MFYPNAIAYLQDQLWRDARSGLCAYSLAMINNVTYNVVEFAKSMVSPSLFCS